MADALFVQLDVVLERVASMTHRTIMRLSNSLLMVSNSAGIFLSQVAIWSRIAAIAARNSTTSVSKAISLLDVSHDTKSSHGPTTHPVSFHFDLVKEPTPMAPDIRMALDRSIPKTFTTVGSRMVKETVKDAVVEEGRVLVDPLHAHHLVPIGDHGLLPQAVLQRQAINPRVTPARRDRRGLVDHLQQRSQPTSTASSPPSLTSWLVGYVPDISYKNSGDVYPPY